MALASKQATLSIVVKGDADSIPADFTVTLNGEPLIVQGIRYEVDADNLPRLTLVGLRADVDFDTPGVVAVESHTDG